MELKIFTNSGNHTFREAPVSLKEVVTADDTENISPGQLVHDQAGNRFEILEVRQLPGQMWRVVMLPEQKSQNR